MLGIKDIGGIKSPLDNLNVNQKEGEVVVQPKMAYPKLVRIQISYMQKTRKRYSPSFGSQYSIENYLIYMEFQIFRYIL